MPEKNEVFEIKVYDKDNKVIKTCRAVDASLKFGAVRRIMALLDIDNIDDTGAVFRTVYGAWDQLTEVLSQFFPDMEDSDWDNVYVEELIPVVLGIARTSIKKIMKIPHDSKN